MADGDFLSGGTPSAFHDRARRRPPRHDVMQREFLAFLRSRKVVMPSPTELISRQVEGEFPLVRNGQVISFVDAVEILDVGLLRTVSLFEIKPVIDTVYGILRQVRSQLQLAQTLIPANVHVINIVGAHGDPMLAELRAEWPHTWAWGATFIETGCDE